MTNESVRHMAYLIWEKEGRPEGRADDHWRMAEEKVQGSHQSAKGGEGTNTAKTAARGAGSQTKVPRQTKPKTGKSADSEEGAKKTGAARAAAARKSTTPTKGAR
ncbi:MAG: DUF2934 domain-containing protein [Beijerinckiaceae bacterium]|nr:DUF2934 domain-containing protein [Beijerinckiaceae bacterium]